MKNGRFIQKTFIVALTFFVIALVLAFTNYGTVPEKKLESLEDGYERLLQDGEYKLMTKRLKSTYLTETFDHEVYAAGQAIATNATKGVEFMDILHADSRLLTKSIEAELLMQAARGPEMKRSKLKLEIDKLDLITTDQIAERAIQLIDHKDPYVRGLAEFAISIRVGFENSTSLKEFPGELKPVWYDKWINAIEGNKSIDFDYIRQSAALGIHRSSERIYQETKNVVSRAENLLTYLKETGSTEQVALAKDKFLELNSIANGINDEDKLPKLRNQYLALRNKARELVMLNPDFDFDQLIFAQHHAFHDFGNITNGGKSFVIKPGGDLYIKDGFNPSGKLTGLLTDKLGPGHTKGYELHYDADKIIFSYAKQPNYYGNVFYESDQGFDDKAHGLSLPNNIYELNLKDRNIRQITDDMYHVDMEPTYLPNGEIVFSSDRSDFGSQCCGNFFQNKRIINQFKMSADGTGIRPMSNNVHYDRYNHVLDNGLLIYTRWEYQERHLWQTHNLWTSRPDGSYAEAIYKQHINKLSPMALRDARQIYGTNKLVAIGCGHHEWEQGAVMVIDPAGGINDPDGMVNLTPKISKREGGIGKTPIPASGGIQDNGGLYQQPFALSENSFLVAYSYNYPRVYTHGFNFGLYYIDVFGNKELIHRDPVLSSWYPVPLKKRELPPVINEYKNPDIDYATVFVSKVNQGVPEVKDGEIKYIRVAHHTYWPAEQISDKPHHYNHLHYTPSGSWSRTLGMSTWSPARIIGTVPVEEDGSAHFKVPPDVPVYFQALDENMLEVRRMRTFVTLQGGEVRGCVGCHETRDESPQIPKEVPLAMRRPADMPKPPSWGQFTLPDYEEHIHPIIEANCSNCHGETDPAAGLEFSSRRVDGYYQAYRTMFGLKADQPTPVQELAAFELNQGKGHNMVVDRASLEKMENNEYPGQLITISNKFSDNSVTKVRQFGSGNSKFVDAILSDYHKEVVNLSPTEWEDLVTWIDANAPYWGTFIDKEPVRNNEPPRRIKVEIGEAFGMANDRK